MIALLVLGGQGDRPAVAQDDGGDSVSFRIVTYNIAAGRNADLAIIASVIDSLSADVVALQEVATNWEDVSHSVDQAQTLANLLEMQHFSAPIYSVEDTETGARHFGLAVLTRHEVVHHHNHRITRLSTQEETPEPRLMPGFPEVLVDVDGIPIRIFNTHLDYRRDPQVREQQVEDMLGIIGEFEAPTLLVGDLNARPDAPEIQPLLTRFQDAWDKGEGPGFSGPVSDPDRRIDYILLSPDCTAHAAFVEQAETSDHFPVVADITCRR